MKGLGMDLCEITRFEKVLERGDGFLQRFYAPEEQAYLAGRGAMVAQSAAAMFAAKEAFLKAAGIGISGGVPLSDVAVHHEDSGRPVYALGGKALEVLHAMGAQEAWLSLSHEAGMAAAVCVLE